MQANGSGSGSGNKGVGTGVVQTKTVSKSAAPMSIHSAQQDMKKKMNEAKKPI